MRLRDCKERSDASGVDCNDYDSKGRVISIVKPEFADECDINTILSRYTPATLAERLAAVQGTYGDFSSVMDRGEAELLLNATREAFLNIDAKIRRQFNNSIEEMHDFLADPKNHDEAVKLGLIEPVNVSSEANNVPPSSVLDVNGGTDSSEAT